MKNLKRLSGYKYYIILLLGAAEKNNAEQIKEILNEIDNNLSFSRCKEQFKKDKEYEIQKLTQELLDNRSIFKLAATYEQGEIMATKFDRMMEIQSEIRFIRNEIKKLYQRNESTITEKKQKLEIDPKLLDLNEMFALAKECNYTAGMDFVSSQIVNLLNGHSNTEEQAVKTNIKR